MDVALACMAQGDDESGRAEGTRMAAKSELEIVIKAVDKASKELSGIDKVLGGLGKTAAIAGGAILGVVTATGVIAVNLAKDAAQFEKVEKTWKSLTGTGKDYRKEMDKLRDATRGMVRDQDLLQATNKFLAMGLADSNDEAAKLLEMSTQLSMAMGYDATQGAEDFAMMLANQSIPRLDNFGISSGKVRERIEELMAADQNLTREQAFMNAVMEEGTKTMERVGEQGEGTSANMMKLKANVENLKLEIGERFAPVLAVVSEKLVETWNDPRIQAGIDNVLKWLEKLIGDENSGIVGIITKLFEGDIPGAFDLAFGEGSWKKIQTFVNNFEKAMGNLKKVVDATAAAIRVVLDLFDETKAREAGTGYQRMMGITPTPVPAIVSTDRGWGRQHGGSFIVPGIGTGDRPYILGLEPGERVDVTPRTRVGAGGGAPISLTININTPINLADRNFVERELYPYIETGMRRMLAGA